MILVENRGVCQMKNKKGFTLIELLAVIVILGLLMAIAIPSVTKYITESRKKTVVSTIGNYITAMVNEVNDLTYTFTKSNTIYAVPIECIALERGGTNPFGAWHQASNAYWAYVLVQYNDDTSSYTYGYTFKDSAGYGLYPTSQAKLNEQGKQIQTGLDIVKPSSGNVVNITSLDNWSGFKVDENTSLIVLDALSEGEVGNGKTTCTLSQKGTNYEQVESDREKRLSNLILKHNTVITAKPTLTTSSNNTSDASGLYVSTDTNSGEVTYYFRGDVKNNFVKFANQTWRIIRINEDGTVRIILNGRINDLTYFFNNKFNTYDKMYYSNSDAAKTTLDNWYKTNIKGKGYDSYISTECFCEQIKVKYHNSFTGGNATFEKYQSYIPNFKCVNDGNDKGILNLKVGLISYDEVALAGGYYKQNNNNYYLYNGVNIGWTTSPAGFWDDGATAYVWAVGVNGDPDWYYISSLKASLRPVINLKCDVLATGTGTSSDPYVVQTN